MKKAAPVNLEQGRAHICAFFNSPDEARWVLPRFVKEGLALGQKPLHTN